MSLEQFITKLLNLKESDLQELVSLKFLCFFIFHFSFL